MGPAIRSHNGFIDKYIGDGIMALFEHADDALRAGLAILSELDAFNTDRRAAGRAPIAVGIGINSGSLMLGTIGEKDRMDGTVISDAVNLASRVESLTKDYRTPLLISEHTWRQLDDPKAYDIRPIDVVVVKGKTEAVTIFEVYQRDPPAERAAKGRTRDLLLSGIEAPAQRDTAAALLCFRQCLALVPDDVAASNLMKNGILATG
jgi:class 3 adenylate cyclase